ncbi:MAG: tolC [Gammaproteobacteria bacterium]|nr:tolC [Gammaproteobacteria bacterium]
MIVVSPQTPRERERRSGPSVDASRDFGNPTTVASAKPTALPGACRALIGTVRTMKARTMKRRATHRLHFLWLSAGLFAGCVSVGPNYHRPPVETPPAFKEAEGWKIAAPRDAEPRGNWWDIYKDPDLDALMRQVQISNQNVLLAVARYEQAVGLLGSARAGYYPTVTADVSTTRSQSTATTTPSSVVTSKSRTVTLDRASLGVSWDIDVWGRIRRTVESNSDAAQASAGDLASALLSAQATLAQSYFQLRVIDLDIGLLERSMGAFQRALDVTQNRYTAGVAQRSDVTQAQTQLESTRAQLLDLSIARATLEHAIAVLVGRPPATVSIPRTDKIAAMPDIPLSLPSELLERRPDIAAAERRAASANAQIGVAVAAYFPDLTLTGSGGYENTSFTRLFELPNRFWSVGPQLAQTLFDGGARRSAKKQAIAVYDQNVATYRQTVLTAFQNVEDDLTTLKILAKEEIAERAAADAAAETLRITENQYKAGTVDYLNVVSAQNASLTAERAARDITSRALTASVNLLMSLGGGWTVDSLPH